MPPLDLAAQAAGLLDALVECECPAKPKQPCRVHREARKANLTIITTALQMVLAQSCHQHKVEYLREIADGLPVSCASCKEVQQNHLEKLQTVRREAEARVWEEAAQLARQHLADSMQGNPARWPQPAALVDTFTRRAHHAKEEG